MIISNGKFVAIEPIVFEKIETKVDHGMARIAQRCEVAYSGLVMDFYSESVHQLLRAGHAKAILRGDAGLQPWMKNVFEINGQKFVMCPIDSILGFEVTE